jgi:hypothetical protein
MTGRMTEGSVAGVGSAKALHPKSGPGDWAAEGAPARVAEHLHARRTGHGRWMAKCPAHVDRSPSLSIAAGRDGRALVRCFAGCELTVVLKAAGLTIGDLFAGPPLKLEQRGTATERDRLHAEQRAQRASERAAEDWLRLRWQALNQAMPRLARTLALMPDNAPGAFALTNHFHHVLAEMRFIDRAISGETE